MGWREDWNRLVRVKYFFLKLLSAVIWLAEKLMKLIK